MSNTSSLWGKYGKSERDCQILDKIVKQLRAKRKRERQNRKKGRKK